MSGKAPPTGPRALLGTQSQQPSSSSSSSSHHLQHPPSSQPPRGPRGQVSGINAPPSKPIPTGPRSLLANTSLNSAHQSTPRHPPKPFPNGSIGLQANRQPISFKGKQPEKAPVPTGRVGESINGRSDAHSVNGDSGDQPLHAGTSLSAKQDSTNLDVGSSNSATKNSISGFSASFGGNNDRAAISIPIPLSASAVKDKLAKPASPFTNGVPSQQSSPRPPSVPPPPPPPVEEPPPPPPPSLPPPPVPPGPTSPSRMEALPPPPPASEPPPPPPPANSPPPPPPSHPPAIPDQPPPPSSSPPPGPPSAGPSKSPAQNSNTSLPAPAKISIPLPQAPHLAPTQPSSSPRPISPAVASPSPVAGPSHRPTPPPATPSPAPPPQPQKLYSLPPAPAWPPSRSEYPADIRSYKVLFDPSLDTYYNAVAANSSINLGKPSTSQLPTARTAKRDPTYYKALIEHVRKHGDPTVVSDRIKGKGKGKEVLLRYEGEVVGGGDMDVDGQGEGMVEEEVVVSDPRKVEPGKTMMMQRSVRDRLLEVEYEHDAATSVDPPATGVVITNIPTLTSPATLKNYYRTFGNVVNFEWQIDRSNGAPLGVLHMQFLTNEEAKRCVKAEDGRSATYGMGVTKARPGQEEPKLRAVQDKDGLVLKAVLKLIEEKKSWERMQQKRREQGLPPLVLGQPSNPQPPPPPRGPANGPGALTPNSTHSQSVKPTLPAAPPPLHRAPSASGSASATPSQLPPHPEQPRNVEHEVKSIATPQALPPKPTLGLPQKPQPSSSVPIVAVPAALIRARATIMATSMTSPSQQNQLPTPSHELSAMPMHGRSNTPSQLPPKPPAPAPAISASTSAAAPRNRPPPGMYKTSYRPLLERDRDGEPSPFSPHSGRDRERDRDGWRAGDDRDRGRNRDWRRDHWTSRGRDGYRRSRSRSRSRSRGRRDRSFSWERARDRSRDRFRPREFRDWRSTDFPEWSERDIRRAKQRDEQDKAAEREKHEAIVEELAKNGKEHVCLPLVSSTVQEEDVRRFFEGFNVDKIFKDQLGWYLTFLDPTAARRAQTVLSNNKILGFQPVTITTHQPPAPPKKKVLDEDGMVAEARQIIIRELKATLEEDIKEQVVGPEILSLIVKEKENMMRVGAGSSIAALTEKRGLKGLSFKKQRKSVVEELHAEPQEEPETVEHKEEEEEGEEEETPEPPKKRRKKDDGRKPNRRIVEEDLESEEEEEAEADVTPTIEVVRKRSASEEQDETEEPVKKKHRVETEVVESKSKKHVAKKKTKKATKKTDEIVEDVVYTVDPEFDVPAVADVHVTPTESPAPSPAPEPKRKPHRAVTPPPTPPPDPYALGLCDDDEDLYFLKLAVEGWEPHEDAEEGPETPSVGEAPPFRKHITGSARTEGFYKITHAEKSAYVAQYQARAATSVETVQPVEEPQQVVTSSRSNRANARRRAQGLEEMNQLQKAITLSKGENAANELTFKFNQLQTRKKHLRFARSPIHDWGLYAMEKIMRGEMVIEYVGEVIRAQVADKREKAYERQGIGSSYLFRIDEDLVVDATKKGNLGRLINHSCDPNCTAKIITINGEKKIVIYAKQDIELGDEITYDYHFPFEQDKIPCLCGSAKCRGFLN